MGAFRYIVSFYLLVQVNYLDYLKSDVTFISFSKCLSYYLGVCVITALMGVLSSHTVTSGEEAFLSLPPPPFFLTFQLTLSLSFIFQCIIA